MNENQKLAQKDLKVCAHNVRGIKLSHPQDYQTFSRLYLEPGYDIIVLIETQQNPQVVVNILRNRFRLASLPKYDIRANEISNIGKRGIVTLVKSSCKLTVQEYIDPDPNFTKIILKNDHQSIAIFAVYAPSQENKEKINFLSKLYMWYLHAAEDIILLIGDWNCTLNAELDRDGYKGDPHKHSRNMINSWIDKGEVIDLFRNLYPDVRSFTRFKDGLSGRIDFVLGNIKGASCCKHVFHRPVEEQRSDHSIIVAHLIVNISPTGIGIFRAQPLLEKNKLYQFKVKETILDVLTSMSQAECQDKLIQRFYGNRIHTLECKAFLSREEAVHLNEIKQLFCVDFLLESKQTMSYGTILEYILMKLMNLTKAFQKKFNKVQKNVITSLQDEIENPSNSSEQVSCLKFKLEVEIHKSTLKDAVKLNSHHLIKDERLSKEVMSIEKKIMGSYVDVPALTDPNTNLITKDPKKISEIMTNFMKEIYKPPPYISSSQTKLIRFLTSDGDDHILQIYKDRSLSAEERDALESPITVEELRVQLFHYMKPHSSPGCDGFTVSWLQQFFPILGPLIAKVFNEGLEKGELSHTLRTAIMKLLPKGSKSRLDPNNYRPISLLSIFYKIGSGAITRRISKVYEKIVGPHQCAYSKARNISSVPINVLNAISHCIRNKEKALVIACDFRKAFDSISHTFIEHVLELLNFGPNLIGFVKLFFQNRNTYILLSGILGEKIPLKQSVPQGDILSPTIFNIVTDPLLLKIINTKNMKGIMMGGVPSQITLQQSDPFEYRSNSFADDATSIIQAKEVYLRFFVKIINNFTQISGLHANLNKTMVIPVGYTSWDQTMILAPDLGLQWTNDFKLLGFHIDNKLEDLNKNTRDRLDIIRSKILTWTRFNLSMQGRVNIAKGLLVSQLSFQVTVLDIPQNTLKAAERLMIDYIKKDT